MDCENCSRLRRKLVQRDKLKLHSDTPWIRAAKEALDGKPQSLQNLIAMFEDYPVDVELSPSRTLRG